MKQDIEDEVRRFSVDFSGICKGMLKFAGALCLCTGLVLACPKDSQAAARQAEVKTRSSYVVKIEAPSVDVYILLQYVT